jgi:hypothetical protein
MNKTINIFHQDKFKVSFSNIPGLVDINDLSLFDGFVKSVNLPGFSIDIDKTFEFQGYQIQNPSAHKVNTQLGDLSIEFKLCENLRNYSYLWQWLYNIRTGQNVDTEAVRKYVCKNINVSMLDNNNLIVSNFVFKNCFCNTLSDIVLTTGSGDEVTFTSGFSYERLSFEENERYFECKEND